MAIPSAARQCVRLFARNLILHLWVSRQLTVWSMRSALNLASFAPTAGTERNNLMKAVKLILVGIAFILFGGVCLAVNEVLDISEMFEMFAVFSPFVGIFLAVLGAFLND